MTTLTAILDRADADLATARARRDAGSPITAGYYADDAVHLYAAAQLLFPKAGKAKRRSIADRKVAAMMIAEMAQCARLKKAVADGDDELVRALTRAAAKDAADSNAFAAG